MKIFWVNLNEQQIWFCNIKPAAEVYSAIIWKLISEGSDVCSASLALVVGVKPFELQPVWNNCKKVFCLSWKLTWNLISIFLQFLHNFIKFLINLPNALNKKIVRQRQFTRLRIPKTFKRKNSHFCRCFIHENMLY